MADPVRFQQHVAQGLQRLLSQFKGKPNFEAVLTSFLDQAQEIEDMLFSLMAERYVDTAIGVQLDGIGDVVDELRLGQTDVDYRVAIKGRIRANRGSSRIEDVLFLFTLLLPTSAFVLAEGTIASFTLTVQQALGPSDPSPEALGAQLQRVKGGGIRATLIWGDVPADERFTYASGDTLQGDVARGYANDSSTQGGAYSGAL